MGEEEDQQVDEYSLDKVTRDDLRMIGGDHLVPDQMYQTFDMDGSGDIEGSELEVPLQRVAPLIAGMMTETSQNAFDNGEVDSVTEQQPFSDPATLTVDPAVESVFNGIDSSGDGNGLLHVDEYDRLWLRQSPHFALMDNDGSGDLSALEALHVATGGQVTVNPGAAPLTEEVARGYWQATYPETDFPSDAFRYWNHQGGDSIEAPELASRVVVTWDALDANQDGHATLTEQVLAHRAEIESYATVQEHVRMRDIMMYHFSIPVADLQAAVEPEVPADEAGVDTVSEEVSDDIIEAVDAEVETIDADGDADLEPETEVPADVAGEEGVAELDETATEEE